MPPLYMTIDTAHPTATVAISDEKQILASRQWANTPKVGTDLLLYIDEVLKEVQAEKTTISRIGIHVGPGSYGLVRTGIVTATVYAKAIGAKIVALTGEDMHELVENTRKGEVASSVEPKYS